MSNSASQRAFIERRAAERGLTNIRCVTADMMATHFCTGGTMPSDDLLLHVQDGLAIEQHWRVGGTHDQKTAEACLANMDAHREAIDEIFAEVYGTGEVARWRVRWRVFFMACAELFGYRGGQEWLVSHDRFGRHT